MNTKLFSSTLRALLVPRRLLPLSVVLASVVVAEWLSSHTVASLLIDLFLFVAFCVIAPAAWRGLSSNQISWIRSAFFHLAYLAICLTTVALVAYLPISLLRLSWTYVVEPPSFGLLVVLVAVGGWGLGRDIDLEEGVASERRRGDLLAIEAERSQLLALRTHLDPHFLFNTLNAIAEWCREDPVVAENAILHLSTMLRYVLEGIEEPTWKLSSEIDLLKRFFELYRIRDCEKFKMSVEMDDPIPDVDLPPMILLPVFENAITHGPSAGNDGTILLRVRQTREPNPHGVTIEIRNPGIFRARRIGGRGIEIVERRIALAYNGRARLLIEADDDSTTTSVFLPSKPTNHESLS